MMHEGLSSEEAKSRLKQHGYNELPSAKPKTVWGIAFEVMKEPMFILLIACGTLYILLGDLREGIILLASIFIVIFITFFQNQKTERALEALRNLSSPRALVIRDQTEVRIPGRDVVPGDLVILNEGDRVPADGRIVETSYLAIDESLLTGESLPVTKSVQQDTAHDAGSVFSGTLVVQGQAKAVILATGLQTRFGKIGTSLAAIEPEETRLHKEMKVLVRNLFLAGMLISSGIVALFYFSQGNFIRSLLNGLAAAMAILPEEFPVVLTIFLALGAWRLSRKKVLTRKPSAIETLGAATVLCTDKTGTITQNKMEVAVMYGGDAIFGKDQFSANNEIQSKLITSAFLASEKDSVDPMEKAIAAALQIFPSASNKNLPLLRDYPLNRMLNLMTRVYRTGKENECLACCKGAPESLLTLCNLSHGEKEKYLAEVTQLAQKGLRVIAVGSAILPGPVLPESQDGFRFHFDGLLGFEDPIRQEVPAAITECRDAGIRVIMITGDYPVTAKSIARQIGMAENEELLTGEDLRSMTDEELQVRIRKASVFARIVPEQKLRIVEALKANHEIVAMTGDGVNDAPALKAAHIGIAMGNKGTDVAREASSLVLLDDNFASIVAAIRSGRRIFDNLQKAMSYIIAIHMPIIGLTLVPAFLASMPILLMPLQIVFMELIIDPVCSIAFETEKEEKGLMNRPPRNPDEKFFGGKNIVQSAAKGILLLAMVLTVYFLSIEEGHSAGEIRAIAFSSLIIGNVFLILSSLSRTRSIVEVMKSKNAALRIIIGTALLMLIVIISVPSIRSVFNFEFPGYSHFISSLTGAFVVLVILETAKFFTMKNSRTKSLHT